MSNTIVGGREPGRNETCPCGSGLKYKRCHGDPEKIAMVNRFSAALMGQLIRREQMEKGLVPWPYTCKMCGKSFVNPKNSAIAPGTPMCPHCDSIYFEKNEEKANATSATNPG